MLEFSLVVMLPATSLYCYRNVIPKIFKVVRVVKITLDPPTEGEEWMNGLHRNHKYDYL